MTFLGNCDLKKIIYWDRWLRLRSVNENAEFECDIDTAESEKFCNDLWLFLKE